MDYADDILEEIGCPRAGTPSGAASSSLRASAFSDPLLSLMHAGQIYDLDSLAEVSGVDGVRMLPRLLDLELHGLVRRVDGGRFMRQR